MLSVVMYFIGGLLISLCAAAIFVLAFETPFTRVEKILVPQNWMLLTQLYRANAGYFRWASC